MGRTYVDYVRQKLNRMERVRNELESIHRDAEVQSELLTSNILDLCITKSNPCSPHAAHLPSLWACTTHIAIQGSGPAGSPVTKVALLFIAVSPAAGSHTSLSHGPWVGKFFLLGKTLTVIPRGL